MEGMGLRMEQIRGECTALLYHNSQYLMGKLFDSLADVIFSDFGWEMKILPGNFQRILSETGRHCITLSHRMSRGSRWSLKLEMECKGQRIERNSSGGYSICISFSVLLYFKNYFLFFILFYSQNQTERPYSSVNSIPQTSPRTSGGLTTCVETTLNG